MTINFILENWFIILALVAVGMVAGIAVYRFLKQPKAAQLIMVRRWLLWAVIEAEKDLGSGTGQLKLRRVYDWFLTRFPWMAKVIPFEMFDKMVVDALDEMRALLEENEAVAAYVSGELFLKGVAVEDLDDNQLRCLLKQMGFAYTESMTRDEMLAALDEGADVNNMTADQLREVAVKSGLSHTYVDGLNRDKLLQIMASLEILAAVGIEFKA